MANVYWKGATSTDRMVAANWLDATGAALGRVPGQSGYETDVLNIIWTLPGAAGNPLNIPSTAGAGTMKVAGIVTHADVGLNLGPGTLNMTNVTVTGNVSLINLGMDGGTVEGNVTTDCTAGPPASLYSVTIDGDLTFVAADSMAELDDVTVGGDATLTYGNIIDFDADGACEFQGDLTATGTVASGDFTVAGDATLDAFVRYSGAATITGAASLSDMSCVVDDYTFNGTVTINDAMTLTSPIFNGVVNDLGGANWVGADADAETTVINIMSASLISGGDYNIINVLADCELALVDSAVDVRIYASCQVDAGFGAAAGDVIHLMSRSISVDGGGGDYLPNASLISGDLIGVAVG